MERVGLSIALPHDDCARGLPMWAGGCRRPGERAARATYMVEVGRDGGVLGQHL